jgi:Flp pilus assembly protein TadD
MSAPPLTSDDRLSPRSMPAAAAHVSEPADSTRDVVQEDFLFHLYRGSELLQENRVLEAKEELEFALTMQPFDPKGQDLLGAVYFRLGLYPRAIQIYEGLCLQFARDVSVKINLALCYLKTGQPEPARRTLQDAVRLNPEHKRAWGYLGLALQKLGELEQAQIAFERGGQSLMAKRMTERRQRATVPAPQDGSAVEIDEGVRHVAETAFSELDAGELRFALAEPGTPQTGPWHTLELGDAAARAKSPYSRTLPPASVREPAPTHESLTAPPPPRAAILGDATGTASTRLVPPPPQPERLPSPPPPPPLPPASVAEAPPPFTEQVATVPRPTTPSLLALPPDRAVTVHSTGALLARATDDSPFAARLEALRVISGAFGTRALHRRTRDADSTDVLGGIGSPIVRVSGSAQLVLGPRAGHEVRVLTLEDDLAFLREDAILGFELRLAYENGKLTSDAPADSPRASAEALNVVQLRGTGAVALELARKLANVPCMPGRSLLVRREWIVGWIGRLVPRALPPGDSPSGQRGLVGFSGEGTVLVCAG